MRGVVTVLKSNDHARSPEEASVAPHLMWDAGLWMGYAQNPLLVYRIGDNARLGPLVEGLGVHRLRHGRSQRRRRQRQRDHNSQHASNPPA